MRRRRGALGRWASPRERGVFLDSPVGMFITISFYKKSPAHSHLLSKLSSTQVAPGATLPVWPVVF